MITVEYKDHAGDDLGVVNAARVTHGEERDEFDEQADAGLIRFLSRGMTSKEFNKLYADIKHDMRRDYVVQHLRQFRNTPVHKSPFNQVWAKFRVTMPVFIARQLVKHEYMPWNERSGRYEEGKWVPSFYWPEADDWREDPGENVKQGSGDPLPPEIVAVLEREYEELIEKSKHWYELSRHLGLCAEQARMGLPQSMMTTVIWSGTLHAFANMLKLRLDPHAQKEAQDVAKLILPHMQELFPVSTEALLTNGI